MTSTRRRATYDDLLRVPDTMVAEIIDGELITNPRPAVRHAHSGSVIVSDLIGSFDGPPGSSDKPGGWWILFEPELVDAIARTLEIYRLEHGRWVVAATYAGDAVVRAEPFAAIELALARWWLSTRE